MSNKDNELEQLKIYAQKQGVDPLKVEAAYLALADYRDYINQRAIDFNSAFFDESRSSAVYFFMIDCIKAYANFQEDRWMTHRVTDEVNAAHVKYMNNLVKKANKAAKSLSIKKLTEFLDADVFQAEAPREIERLKAGLPETAQEIVTLIESVRSRRLINAGEAFIEAVVGSLTWWSDIDMPDMEAAGKTRDKHYLVEMLVEFDPITSDYYQTVYHREKKRQYGNKTVKQIGSKFIKPRAIPSAPIEKRR